MMFIDLPTKNCIEFIRSFKAAPYLSAIFILRLDTRWTESTVQTFHRMRFSWPAYFPFS